jgi:transcriptional regulator with XRE-family HTH domain
MKSQFGEWIERQFLAWQTQQGQRKTIEEFAAWLGIKRSTVGQWLNDQRKPSPENIGILAMKLGAEAYDFFDMPRPNQELQRVRQSWEDLSEEEQAAFAAEIERTAADNKQKSAEKLKRERTSKKSSVTRPSK